MSTLATVPTVRLERSLASSTATPNGFGAPIDAGATMGQPGIEADDERGKAFFSAKDGALGLARRALDELLVTPLEHDDLLAQLRGLELYCPGLLLEIALSNSEPIIRRGAAARIAVHWAPEDPRVAELATHPNPLIRIGVVLGYADAEQPDHIGPFLSDASRAVREEAELAAEEMGH